MQEFLLVKDIKWKVLDKGYFLHALPIYIDHPRFS